VNGGLVSVVIAAFNEEAFIAEALQSVLAQTYRPFEVIVVDDGSDDRTAEIAGGHDISLLCRPHLGASAARNAGLALAQGDYWTVFDADDVMPPERLAGQVAHLEEHPELGMVLGLTEAFVSPGEPRPAHYNPVWDDGPYRGHPGTMLVRRSILQSVGPFDETLRLGEDVDWLARAKDAGVQAGQVDHLALRYRIHRGNTSSDVRANQHATLRVLRTSLRRQRTRSAGD
jgi:glycosyltransferase involved in cell wall biosynthesis